MTFLTKQDYVYSKLKKDIMSGTLPPDSKIVVNDIAASCGVSPMPVREAIARLHHDGLIYTSPHIGARVSPFNFEEHMELMMIRTNLERMAIKLSVPYITDEIIQELEDINKELSEINQRERYYDFATCNRKFHLRTFDYGPYKHLYELIESLMAKMRFSYSVFSIIPERSEASIAEHAEIIEALRNRDAEKATEVYKIQKYRSNLRFWEHIKELAESGEHDDQTVEFFTGRSMTPSEFEAWSEDMQKYIDMLND